MPDDKYPNYKEDVDFSKYTHLIGISTFHNYPKNTDVMVYFTN